MTRRAITYPANTLSEAIRALDPNHTLNVANDQDAQLFVDRKSHALKKAKQLLTSHGCTKLLFSGSRGNGKSTELSKLEAHLDEFWVVRFSANDKLDLADLTYIDILLAVPLQMLRKAADENLPLAGSALKRAKQFQAEITTEKESKESAGVEVKGGLKESLLGIFGFEAKMAREEATRRVLREKVSHRLSDLNALVGDLDDEITQLTGKRPLVIIEDIDKADIERSIDLFYRHGNSLSSIPVCIIFTFPIALQHDQNFNQIRNFFNDSVTLENFRTHKRDDQPDQEGIDRLTTLLTKRVKQDLFSAEALRALVDASGGVPRVLIQLARDAVIEANLDDEPPATRVEEKHALTAIGQYRATFARILTSRQLTELAEINKTKEIDPGNREHRNLLHNLSVLEYANGSTNPVWYDIAPVVKPLLPAQP